MAMAQLVRREQVVQADKLNPIETVLLDAFIPLMKFRYAGEPFLKEKMIRGSLNSSLIALERTLRGPLPAGTEGALPLEPLCEESKAVWCEHMKQFSTAAQAMNDPKTSRLKRNMDFAQARAVSLQQFQHGLKTVYFKLYGEAWIPHSKRYEAQEPENYDCEDAVNDFFKELPEVKTAMVHGISGGGKRATSSARSSKG